MLLRKQYGFICSALKRFRRKEDAVVPQEELVARFEVRDRFLSDCELLCHRLLCQAVGQWAIVCPKPRVLETLRVLDAHQHLDEAIRIERKHVDFLVCDLATGHPLCAVQIDCWDHEAEAFRPREGLLQQAFELAGLPVVYVPSNQLPTADRLNQQIEGALAMNKEDPISQVHGPHDPAIQAKHAREQNTRERLT